MAAFTSETTGPAPCGEGRPDASIVAVDMPLGEFRELVVYSMSLDAYWRRGGVTFPSLHPEASVTLPSEDLERLRSYQATPIRYDLRAPFGIRYHVRRFLGENRRMWRAMGVVAGILAVFAALPFAAYVAVCLACAVADGDFELAAALAMAFA